MLTNEQMGNEDLEDIASKVEEYGAVYISKGMALDLIAQAKEANALLEQLATARQDALEEAAKVCEEDRRIHDWSHCVEAIRALKEKV